VHKYQHKLFNRKAKNCSSQSNILLDENDNNEHDQNEVIREDHRQIEEEKLSLLLETNDTSLSNCIHDGDPICGESKESILSTSTGNDLKRNEPSFRDGFKRSRLVSPIDIHNIIMSVSSLVAEEIRFCHYGYSGNVSEESKRRSEEAVLKAESAAVAVQKFAMDVVFPNVLASYAENAIVDSSGNDSDGLSDAVICLKRNISGGSTDSASSSGQDNDDLLAKLLHDRIIVSVLLNLREVLIINGKQLFGIEQEAEKGQDNSDCIHGEPSENIAIKLKTFSTAIVLNAVDRIQDSETRLSVMELYLDAIEKYDRADEEFACCLKRLNVRALGVSPHGRILKKYENIAFRVSHNTARLGHPLISKQVTSCSITIPPSNAMFLALFEHKKYQSTYLLKSDESRNKTQILKMYREKMKNMHLSP
jgi:hypothetical protein